MNSLQLLQRLLRHSTEPSIGNAPADLLLTALEKANEALEAAFNILPPKYSEAAEGFDVRAPEDITLTLTATSKTVSGYTFSPYQIGCSVVITSDNIVNTVTASDTMLLAAGVTGSVAARIYYDAIPMTAGIRKLVSDPMIAPTNANITGAKLTRWEPHTAQGFSRPWNIGSHIYLLSTYNPGSPQLYYISGNRSSRPRELGQPIALINVWPMPTSAHRLSIEAQWSPTRLTMSDWTSPVEMPIDDRFANNFAAMAESRMTATRYWACPNLTDGILRQGIAGEIALSQADSDFGLPNSLVRTSPGY